MQFIKCKECGKKLFKHDIHEGKVEIYCPRCGTINIIEAVMKPEVKSSIKEQSR